MRYVVRFKRHSTGDTYWYAGRSNKASLDITDLKPYKTLHGPKRVFVEFEEFIKNEGYLQVTNEYALVDGYFWETVDSVNKVIPYKDCHSLDVVGVIMSSGDKVELDT